MKLKVEVTFSMVLYHRKTLNSFSIDKTFKQEFDENSEEYKKLISDYEKLTGTKRTKENADDFDSDLLMYIAEGAKHTQKEHIDKIIDVVYNAYAEGKNCAIFFGGYVIDAAEFCAIRINDFSARISKQ